jgi:DNA-binding response OmpR family regulator
MTTPAPAGSSGAVAPDASSRITVLLVEDDPSIGGLVRTYLGRDGYPVVWVRSGEDALDELGRHDVGLVVLDVGLPGMDGFDVCRRMRAITSTPIVMLTARDEEPDRVVGLELGADDYITKPFSLRELSARIKAVLRRTEGQLESTGVVTLGDIVLTHDSREVTVAGTPVELTAKEFKLLAYLGENAGKVVSRETLLDRVWGMTYAGGTRTVDVHVAQLRRKLGRPDLIQTVRGAGYKAIRT